MKNKMKLPSDLQSNLLADPKISIEINEHSMILCKHLSAFIKKQHK